MDNYYKAGDIETIDFIKSQLTPEEYKGFLKGNVIKYVARASYKDSEENDVEKMKYYSDCLYHLLNQ